MPTRSSLTSVRFAPRSLLGGVRAGGRAASLAVALAVVLPGVLAGAACGGPAADRPLSAIDAYRDALRRGDWSTAYGLMSERYRREHSQAEFEKMMKDSPAEVKSTVTRLGASGRQVEVQARFVYDDLRDELPLVQEGGKWRLAADPLDFYPQKTPGQALRSFVRAVQLERWDVVLRFIPSQWRAGVSEDDVKRQFKDNEETANMMRLLEANLDNPIDELGDEARMPYAGRYEVKFQREDGVWKIADPD